MFPRLEIRPSPSCPDSGQVGHSGWPVSAPSVPAASTVLEVVPEWVLDLPISDSAFRLYAVLARYGNSSGIRMPGRALLAKRTRKSVDSVDRALRELTEADVLEIERRVDSGRHLTNRYHLRTVDPDEGGRTVAATGQLTGQPCRSLVAQHDCWRTRPCKLRVSDTRYRPPLGAESPPSRRQLAARSGASSTRY